MNKTIIKWTIVLSLATVLYYFIYNEFLKFEINDLQIVLIEERLENNYYNNQSSFIELFDFTSQLGTLEMVEFLDGNSISFRITKKDLYLETTNLYWFHATDDSIVLSPNFKMTESDLLNVLSTSTLYDTIKIKDWIISYSGKANSPLVKSLLHYNDITFQQITKIGKTLERLNCDAIDKDQKTVKIRYKGHLFDNFSYVKFLSNQDTSDSLNELSHGIYWEHYISGLCVWTDWGWW